MAHRTMPASSNSRLHRSKKSLRLVWNTPHIEMRLHEHNMRVDAGSVELIAPIKQAAGKPF